MEATTSPHRAPGTADDAAQPANQPRHRGNNFDALRWFAASLVVLGHSRMLLGKDDFLIWGMPISIFGVVIFFSISGYLVTESWIRDPRPGRFFRKRGLRIFPALIVCVTLSVGLLGPALTSLPLSAYWLNGHTWSYFLNGVLRMQHALPGLFAGNPAPGVVNGSLWTLPVEFLCYAAVCAVGARSGRRTSRALLTTAAATVLLATAACFFTFVYEGRPITAYATDLGAASKVMPYFFAGSALRWLGGRVRFRLDVALLLTFALTIMHGVALWRTAAVLGFVLIPYVVIALGLDGTPVLDRWGRRGDFSYGLYLYAFPIQQAIVQVLGPGVSTAGLFALAEGVSMVLAVASWHLVEKRALTLKAPRPRARATGPAFEGIPDPP